MTDCTSKMYQFGAFALLCISGLSVTASYQLAPSVPLMNSFVYSVNLGLNMVFQIAFRLSVYTKNMRCGTILFALAAIQLSQLAPRPFDPKLEQLWQGTAIIWHVIFFLVWAWSLITVIRTKTWPRRNPVKVFAWAVFIAGWGSFTDNWAKINGMYAVGSPTWWAILMPYLGVSMFVMFLSVRAMAATDVALYVPTNLCSQLFMNTVSGMAVWHEYKYVDHLVGYLVGYVVCILSVYISTEEADLAATFSNSREISNHSLSQGQAVTSFGASLVTLANQWQEQEHVEKADLEARRSAIVDALKAGAQTNVFGTTELADLALRLWQRINPNYMPVGTVASWMKTTPFFQDYLSADPTFESKLTRPLSQEERNVMTEDLAALQVAQGERSVATVTTVRTQDLAAERLELQNMS